MLPHKFLKKISFIAIAIFSLFSLSTNTVYAKDLGNIGTTYPIAEKDLLKELQNNALEFEQNGGQAKLQGAMNQALKNGFDHPTPIKNLTTTQSPRNYFFDPTVVFPYDIKDKNGKVLVPAGKRYNPLDTITLNETLVFYNADDSSQVDWAKNIDKKLKGEDKLILVGGSVVDQMKLFKKQIYFDQGGMLTTHFGLQHVPALISQKGNQLLVKEVIS